MKDPYQVLGVSPNATDSEVKAAYRNLAKKYHPDNYAGSPLADVAEEKMKEINEAYDAITEMRKHGGSGSYGSSNSYSGSYSGSYNGSGRYSNVRMMIQQNRLDEAEAILDSETGDHTAEWYFLRGMCYFRRGWTQQAFQHFQRANQMEPNNMEYRQALENMTRQQGFGFGGYSAPSGSGSECSTCDICTGIMCADCLCSCCRGC